MYSNFFVCLDVKLSGIYVVFVNVLYHVTPCFSPWRLVISFYCLALIVRLYRDAACTVPSCLDFYVHLLGWTPQSYFVAAWIRMNPWND